MSPAIAARRSAGSTSNSSVPAASSRDNDIKFQTGLNEDLAATALVGHAAGGAARRRQVRWRVRHVVRQGPRRRSHRRRVPARQFRRHVQTWRRAGADGRRPHRGVVHHRASIRISLRRRDDPDPESGRRAGDHRLRIIRLRDVALLRHLGRAQMHARDGRIDRRGRRPPRPRQDRDARGLHDAGRRAQYPPATTPVLGAGSAALRLQARRDARLHPRQQAQPHHHLGRAERENRHHHHRQEPISTCARRSTNSASTKSACNDLGIRLFKIGCPWPIGAAGIDGFRQRPRSHHRGRGEALADRSAGARGTLRHRESAGLHRQEGRARRMAVPGQGRARSERSRDRHRRAPARQGASRRDRAARCRA